MHEIIRNDYDVLGNYDEDDELEVEEVVVDWGNLNPAMYQTAKNPVLKNAIVAARKGGGMSNLQRVNCEFRIIVM